MVTPEAQKGAQNPDGIIEYIATVRNNGFQTDTFQLNTAGNTFPAEILDETCTTVITHTSALAAGETEDVCVRVTVPVSATDFQLDNLKLKVKSTSDDTVKAEATMGTYAILDDILLVDQDGDIPDVQSYYTTALNTYGAAYDIWDLGEDDVLPKNMLNAHVKVVWYTGNTYPGPLIPYEGELADFLDNDGRLFMSGQDILDQAAGTTAFVHDYLHIDWDGSEDQNDKATSNVKGVGGNPVSGSIGTVPIDHSVLGAAFEDQLTLIAPAAAAFTDDDDEIDAHTLDVDGYKVMFLAFPFESYGSASQKATLMTNALNWFTPAQSKATVKPAKAEKIGKNGKVKSGKHAGQGGNKKND
jgi:hypothetical protein